MLCLFYDSIYLGLTSSHKVGRMMMNSELVMDDPAHTAHLQTLEYAVVSDSSSEIQELV